MLNSLDIKVMSIGNKEMIKVKLVCAALKEFICQCSFRPLINNLQMLINNIRMVFADNCEPLYETKHRLNRILLKKLITLPPTKEELLPVENYRIWVLWWQGEKQMPDIVKCTYKSICAMTKKEVVLITKDNWTEYIFPDEWIVRKVSDGKMKLPALSDYIRASLLYEYGGMWIDSTVLCTKELPQKYFESELFTIHNPHTETLKYVAQGRWNVQILGSNKRHLAVFGGLRHVFREYWKHYDNIMDYLLVDYAIDYVYNEDKEMRELIDKVPVTNINMHWLLDKFDKPYNEIKSEWEKMQENTLFFKLTYKHNFIFEYAGKKTFYQYIIEEWK